MRQPAKRWLEWVDGYETFLIAVDGTTHLSSGFPSDL
jgi:hypothetical protein